MVEVTEKPNSNLPSNTSTLLLRRARVACKACNARRVKCDAAVEQPCWHCRTRQTPCELIESRRGRYSRKRQGLSLDQRLSRDTSARQLTQTPPKAVIPETSHSEIASGQSDGTNGATPAGQSDQDEGLELLFAGTAQPQPTQQTQAGQTQQNVRPHHPGDSFSLSYVVEVVYKPKGGSTEPLKVHYSIPASIADRPAPDHGPRAEELVSLREALTMPARDVADRLIHAFFEIIHPAYPIFDRRNFTRLYLQGEASPLVLQTICLLGFTVGSESLVHAAGYSDRATARKTHYLRAKALYDADYENDRMNIVASLLLLGFWWAGPEDQKDTCYWVGCATIVAQSLGMHRSTSHSVMSQQLRSLRKRIWWSIYVRDRHTAAAFGRPCRIRDEDCDIEPLTEEDFNFDNDYDQRLIPAQKDFHISYVLEMSKLAIILGDILIGEFSPRRAVLERFDTEALAGKLVQWESQLPDQLRRMPPDGSLGAPFWASMLHFSYQNYYILLFRPKSIENLSSADAERDIRARMAADSITRMAEDLLATGTIKFGQIHLVPALFGALSIHTIVICRKDHIRQQLAENKSRQCLLALSELAKSWPVSIWIAKAFVNLMKRLTGQGSPGGSIVSVSSRIASNFSNMATSGYSGSHGPQRATTPKSYSSHIIDENQITSNLDGCEPSTQSNVHAPDPLPQAAGPLFYDYFWDGYPDNTFDVDFLLHNSLGPTLSVPFEDLNGAGEPNATHL